MYKISYKIVKFSPVLSAHACPCSGADLGDPKSS